MTVTEQNVADGAMRSAVATREDRRIAVYVADDHDVVRSGLRSFLASEPDIVVVGEAADGRSAVVEIAQLAANGEGPDVVLMDLVMPELGGVDATIELRRLAIPPRVVIMTSDGDAAQLRAALLAGVSGYLPKYAGAANVVAAVRSAHAGELHLDAAASAQLTEALSPAPAARPWTPRERDVLALVAKGESNRGIAAALFISERTARTHVSLLLRKLGLPSRMRLALWTLEHGFGSEQS